MHVDFRLVASLLAVTLFGAFLYVVISHDRAADDYSHAITKTRLAR